MHVLHVDTGRTLRGGQRQMLMLMRGLDALGHTQALLAQGATLEQRSGAVVSPLRVAKEARKADLIHAHSGRAHTLAALFGRGKPLIVSRRVAFPAREGMLSRWKYTRARHYVAVSEFVRDQLIRDGVPGDSVSVVYDAVATEDMQDGTSLPSTDPFNRPVRVLAPRVDDPLKCADLLREACSAADATLIFSDDLQADLLQADLFAYLTQSEGLGSAILLAMAYKKPVLASRVGGIPEIVEHESTGLLVENKLESVASTVQRLAADRMLARGCAERAYRMVGERFTDNMMVRQTEKVYRAVFAANSPSL